jgi:hypothetical protein
MKHGPEPLDVLKVPRKPSADNEAVDPALGDELVARLSRRLRWCRDFFTRSGMLISLLTKLDSHLQVREESRFHE